MATPSLPKLDNLVSAIQNSINTKLQNSTSEIRTDINILQDYADTKANDSSVVHTTGDETIEGTKTFSSNIVGNLTGNAATSTKLQTTRTINGTNFDGSANITTVQWGTARNISITDGTNTSSAVSVNGSQAYSLNLPSTIKATFVGNITGNVTGNCSGTAGNVAWVNVSGKPSTYTPSSHTHDDRYYTEGEIDTKLDIKADDSSVVHTSNTETVSGTKTFTSAILGDVTGKAGTCKVRFINLVNNNDDLARVMNFTPPSLADVFNSWYRFSHENNYVQYNSSNAVGNALLDIEAWAYDSENNVIKNTRNTNTYVGFVSPDSYNKFTI